MGKQHRAAKVLTLVGAVIAVLAVAALVVSCFVPGPSQVRPAAAPDPAEQICRQFMALRNAHDPKAESLLVPLPPLPAQPITEAEADQLDADLMLHQDVRVLAVYREPHVLNGAGYVIALDGSVSSERLPVKVGEKTEARQRSMWKPDIVVEVRDGLIHGIRPKLHED